MSSLQPFAYPFVDYWAKDEIAARKRRARERTLHPELLGIEPAIDADVKAAKIIVDQTPSSSPFDVFSYFADLTAVGSTGEAFNSRWIYYENPVIVWFFHATHTKPTGDCTSWCAAFLSWALERCGLMSAHSASSQDYAEYGLPVVSPEIGDIVVFRNKRNPCHGHVALFLEEDEDRIRIIGGNQTPGVQIPSCPPGFAVTRISREWRDKADETQPLLRIRRAVAA